MNAFAEAAKKHGAKATCWYVGKKGLKVIPIAGLVLGAADAAQAYNNNGARGVAENIVPYYQESVAGASYLSQKVINDTGSSYKNIPGFSGNHPANNILNQMN